MTTKTINYHIWPRDLPFYEMLLWFEKSAHKRGLNHSEFILCQLHIDKFGQTVCSSVAEMAEILKGHREFKMLSCEQNYTDPNNQERTIQLKIDANGTTIAVSVRSKDIDLVNAVHAEVKDKFALRNPNIPPADSRRDKSLHATVFLGRHFDEEAGHIAQKLQRFLSLIGFDVLEGEEYNSQPIPEKVKQRIGKQDIYIGVITGRREHEWITAEAAYAQGSGKHVILIVQENSGFRPTITGRDLEHIPIQIRAIEQSFIKLLEEFRSVGVSGIL